MHCAFCMTCCSPRFHDRSKKAFAPKSPPPEEPSLGPFFSGLDSFCRYHGEISGLGHCRSWLRVPPPIMTLEGVIARGSSPDTAWTCASWPARGLWYCLGPEAPSSFDIGYSLVFSRLHPVPSLSASGTSVDSQDPPLGLFPKPTYDLRFSAPPLYSIFRLCFLPLSNPSNEGPSPCASARSASCLLSSEEPRHGPLPPSVGSLTFRFSCICEGNVCHTLYRLAGHGPSIYSYPASSCGYFCPLLPPSPPRPPKVPHRATL